MGVQDYVSELYDWEDEMDTLDSKVIEGDLPKSKQMYTKTLPEIRNTEFELERIRTGKPQVDTEE